MTRAIVEVFQVSPDKRNAPTSTKFSNVWFCNPFFCFIRTTKEVQRIRDYVIFWVAWFESDRVIHIPLRLVLVVFCARIAPLFVINARLLHDSGGTVRDPLTNSSHTILKRRHVVASVGLFPSRTVRSTHSLSRLLPPHLWVTQALESSPLPLPLPLPLIRRTFTLSPSSFSPSRPCFPRVFVVAHASIIQASAA